jgi:hypothetical protein
MTGFGRERSADEGKGKSGYLRDDNKKTSKGNGKCKGKGKRDGERNGDWSYLPV